MPSYTLTVVDPKGDLILEVGLPPADSAETQTSTPPQSTLIARDNGDSPQSQHLHNANIHDCDDNTTTSTTDEPEIGECSPHPWGRLLVCSAILVWASPVFKVMLTGPFAEGEAQQSPSSSSSSSSSSPPDHPRTVRLPDDDAIILHRICQELHDLPSTSTANLPQEVICEIAVTADKYDLCPALKAWFRRQLKYFLPEDIIAYEEAYRYGDLPAEWLARQCLACAKVAWLTDDNARFRQATAYYAYLRTPEYTERELETAWGEMAVPDGLADRIVALQYYLVRKFAAIGPALLQEALVEYYIAPLRIGAAPVYGSPVVMVPDGLPGSDPRNESSRALCQGTIMLVGAIAAALTQMHMFSSVSFAPLSLSGGSDSGVGCGEPARTFVAGLRRLASMPFQLSLYRCQDGNCTFCPGNVRRVMQELQTSLDDAVEEFEADGVCLACVKERKCLGGEGETWLGHTPLPCETHPTRQHWSREVASRGRAGAV